MRELKPSIAAIRATMRFDVLETLSAPVAAEGLGRMIHFDVTFTLKERP